MSQKSQMTKSSVQAIMSKRALVPVNMVGKRVKLLIQGQGTTIDATRKDGSVVMSIREEGVVLQKTIFNLKACSGLAMANPRNKQWLTEGLAAEKAGNAALADERFSAYLNATQMSFGILLPNALVSEGLIANGVEIAATVVQIETENGKLLTIDPSTIAVMAPETLDSVEFDISAFEEKEETAAEKKARIKAEQALAKK